MRRIVSTIGLWFAPGIIPFLALMLLGVGAAGVVFVFTAIVGIWTEVPRLVPAPTLLSDYVVCHTKTECLQLVLQGLFGFLKIWFWISIGIGALGFLVRRPFDYLEENGYF